MRLYIAFLSVATASLISRRSDGATSDKYEAVKDMSTFGEAEKACKDKDMVLATIKNEQESLELESYLQNYIRNTSLTGTNDTYNFWIGLRRKVSKPKLWFWEAGKTNCKLKNIKEGFWGVEPPTGVGGGDINIKCVRVLINWGAFYTHKSNWAADRCDDSRTTGYVCQKATESERNS